MISQTFLWRRHTYSQHVLIHEKELNITDHEFSSVQMLSCVQFLRPNEPQHVRPPCPSPTPRVHPNWCPSWWCHPIIWFPVIPFSSCPQSFPASGSFPMSQLSASGGQSIGVSASTSVLPMNTQDWSPLGLLTEAEDIKKRWQEYTEELYKKDLHDPDNHDGVITYLSQTSWNVKSSGLRNHYYEQS